MSAIQGYRNQICVVSHADIVFDGTISNLFKIDLDGKVAFLTSYDYKSGKINDFSVDSWAFKNLIELPFSDFKIGSEFSDMKFSQTLMESDLSIINPSLDIHTTHMDNDSDNKIPIEGDYKFINPTKLNQSIIIRDNKEILKVRNPKVSLVKSGNSVVERKVINNSDNSDNIIIDVKNKKICVIIHLYYQDLWTDFKQLLQNLGGYDYDLYVSVVDGSSTLGQTLWIKDQVENMGGKCYILPNKGLDIGPFLYILNDIMIMGKSYDSIIKLHTKKSLNTAGEDFGNTWRDVLVKSLIGSREIVNRNVVSISLDNIGMLGSKEWLVKITQGNDSIINDYKRKMGISVGDIFVGGTMFWVKYDILRKYFNKFNITKMYDELEEGYFVDHHEPTKTHSLERIFGYMVQDSGYKILGV